MAHNRLIAGSNPAGPTGQTPRLPFPTVLECCRGMMLDGGDAWASPTAPAEGAVTRGAIRLRRSGRRGDLSSHLPAVTAERMQRAIERDGWQMARQHGSHRSFVHPTKAGLVVIPIHSQRDLPPGTLARILKDAGLSPDDLRRLL
jgi:predicted RNA binding protein YcfA (HicA-like mRNA interferase family)